MKRDEVELRQVVDMIPALVRFWSNLADGSSDFSNQGWQDYTGINSEEARGRGWQGAVHPDDLPKSMKAWREMVAGGKAGEFEARLRRHPTLVSHFTALYARRMNKGIDEIPSETMEALVRYRWPGNVRELQNFIERAVILSPHSVLRAPTSELETFDSHRESNVRISGLAQVERDHILYALEASRWVIGGRNGAAERLGMKRTSLVYRMKKLRIGRPLASPGQAPVRTPANDD
jgi:hypothetical protein